MSDNRKRPRPVDVDDEDPIVPAPSKRGKNERDEEERIKQNEGLNAYIVNVTELSYRYMALATAGAGQTAPTQLRYPILPVSHNGQGMTKLQAVPSSAFSRVIAPQRVQLDTRLGVAGLVYPNLNSYLEYKDRFEEYIYRYPEINRAFIKDAFATAWIFYFNKAFKVHQDTYRGDKVNGDYFEYSCPPQYIDKKDEWINRVEAVLREYGSLSDAFPGYGYQNWPATRTPPNDGIEVRYYGSVDEYKQWEVKSRLAVWVLKNALTQPRTFVRVKEAENKVGILFWKVVN